MNRFEIIRAGINTTFQDDGRNHLYHIGIPSSGVMDKRNYILANSLVGNKIGVKKKHSLFGCLRVLYNLPLGSIRNNAST